MTAVYPVAATGEERKEALVAESTAFWVAKV